MRVVFVVWLSLFVQIVFSQPVDLICWTIGYDQGEVARTPSEISNVIDKINRIYAQAGMCFHIRTINQTNDNALARIDRYDIFALSRLRGLTQGSGCLELYFIPSLLNALGLHNKYGVVIDGSATENTVAHEIGHACGLADIYCWHAGTTLRVFGPPSKERMPDDWGWYHPSVMQTNIVRRLLMYGYGGDTKADISYGDIYGLWYTNAYDRVNRKRYKSWQLGLAPVGFVTHGNRNPVSL